jgi:hypothetical protein
MLCFLLSLIITVRLFFTIMDFISKVETLDLLIIVERNHTIRFLKIRKSIIKEIKIQTINIIIIYLYKILICYKESFLSFFHDR